MFRTHVHQHINKPVHLLFSDLKPFIQPFSTMKMSMIISEWTKGFNPTCIANFFKKSTALGKLFWTNELGIVALAGVLGSTWSWTDGTVCARPGLCMSSSLCWLRDTTHMDNGNIKLHVDYFFEANPQTASITLHIKLSAYMEKVIRKVKK